MSRDFKLFLREYEMTPGEFYGSTDDTRLQVHARYLEWRKQDRIPTSWTNWRYWLLFWLVLIGAANVKVWR